LQYNVNGQRLFGNPSGPGSNWQVTVQPNPTINSTGLQADITQWVADAKAALKSNLLANVNYPGASPGTVIAAKPNDKNDYMYHWIRDSGIGM
jgi:hypothetical protein